MIVESHLAGADHVIEELGSRIGRVHIHAHLVHASDREPQRIPERLEDVAPGFSRKADDEIRPEHDALAARFENRLGHPGQVDLLLDSFERLDRSALRRVAEVIASRLAEVLQRLLVERLAARAGG